MKKGTRSHNKKPTPVSAKTGTKARAKKSPNKPQTGGSLSSKHAKSKLAQPKLLTVEDITTAVSAAVQNTLQEFFGGGGFEQPAIGNRFPHVRGSNGVVRSRPKPLPDSIVSGASLPTVARSTSRHRGLLASAAESASATGDVALATTMAESSFPEVPGLDSTMCLLKCQYAGGTWLGSGVLIGKRTVLTVAHNLFNKFDGRTPIPIDRVTVFPGAHLDSGRSSSATRDMCWHPPEWTQFASADDYSNNWRDPSPHDYGVINLPNDTDLGDVTPIAWGAVDEQSFFPEWFQETAVYLFGYPGGQTDLVYPSRGVARPFASDYLRYNMIGEAGMSGGPVYLYYSIADQGYWAFLLAVQSMSFNAGSSSAYSLGVRVTPQVFSNIRRQIQ